MTILGTPALGFAKVTFFLMYYQLFRPKSSLRYLIYIGGITSAVFHIANTISMLVFMIPRPGETVFTHRKNPTYRNVLRFSVPLSAVGAGIDLYILVLPIFAVIQLQLATKHKIGIVLIFMTGSLYVSGLLTIQVIYWRDYSAVIASFLSMYYRILLTHRRDMTWNTIPVLILK